MANRLPIDADIVAYWGFDEAMETDPAIDSSANGLNLAVTSASSVQPGRVANSREFDGSSSYAVAPSSSLLRRTGDLTLIAWVKLYQYNSGGTQLRAIMSCGGPSTSDNVLYSLVVTTSGALSYRHNSASGPVIVETAANVIRTGQLYCVMVRRYANGANQNVEIFVDNMQKTPATISVNGVSQSLPVPPPAANSNAVLSVGRSQREANSAFWYGVIDEVSIHDIARLFEPYLIAAYFRVAIRSESTKLSMLGTIVSISSADMNAGVRWWCYERDGDLYVVMESPFGIFGQETQLTTVGTSGASMLGKPELFYDATNDVLYIFFISGNRIYKLTAASTDPPTTISMPYTADTGSIIKSDDNVDACRLGDGGGQKEVVPSDYTYVNRTPVKIGLSDPSLYSLGDGGGQLPVVTLGGSLTPSVAFDVIGGLFGIVVGPASSSIGGYAVYRIDGGVTVLMGYATKTDPNRYFFAIAPRVYGQFYVVETMTARGTNTGYFSSILIDRFGFVTTDLSGNLHFTPEGDSWDSGSFGDGGGQKEIVPSDYSYVNRTPIKLSSQDYPAYNLGDGGGQSGSISSTRFPVPVML